MRFLPRGPASNAITVFSTVCLLWAGIYAKYIKQAEKHGWDIDLIIMINFCKFHMLAVNYENAGNLDDEVKSKYFTPRERQYAEPLKQRVKFFDFMNYFFFCASSFSGQVHEYRDFIDFINLRNDYSNIPSSKLPFYALRWFAWIPFWAFMLVTCDIIAPKPFLLT